MLDAGSSASDTQGFVDALFDATGTRPSAVVYTHAHWDHVLGGVAVGGVVIAHARTAEQLIELGTWDWSDEGLDRRVVDGLLPAQQAADIKAEMPSPRTVEVAPADIIFHDAIRIDLGSIAVHACHLGGDHSADACVLYVEPDRVLFLGDCTSASPEGVMTVTSATRLREVILGSAAEYYVEGHYESVSTRSEIELLFEKIRRAERAAREGVAIEAPDEDTEYFLEAFRAGLVTTP